MPREDPGHVGEFLFFFDVRSFFERRQKDTIKHRQQKRYLENDSSVDGRQHTTDGDGRACARRDVHGRVSRAQVGPRTTD